MEVEDPQHAQRQREDSDKYSSHKSVSQNLLNTSIIQSHVGLLIYVTSLPYDINNRATTITLTIMSLILQIIMFFMLTWLFYIKQEFKKSCITAAGINALVTGLSGLSLIVNSAITAVTIQLRNETGTL